MAKLKNDRWQFYDKQGNWIGPPELTEPTYYEVLTVKNGIVETNHLISIEWLINRGYSLIEHEDKDSEEKEKTDSEGEPEEEPVVAQKEKVVDPIKKSWGGYKNPPGRPRKY